METDIDTPLFGIPIRCDDDEDDDNEMPILTPVNLSKRTLSEPEDPEQPKKKSRYAPLGLQVNEDLFEIPGIKKLPLPREDGRQWEFWEQTAAAEAKRPYGKLYLDDQEERQRLLSQDPNSRFISELAGALRKQAYELYEEEDMQRLLREREQERLQMELELKRTLVDMDTKYELAEKLKTLAKEVSRELETRRQSLPPQSLLVTSRFLVDNEVLPSSLLINQYFGFLDLLRLQDAYARGAQEVERLLNEEVGSDEEARRILSEPSNRELFFYLYIYFRDFLDNASRYSLLTSLEIKLRYVVDHFAEITGKPFAPPIAVTVKREPGSTTTTTTTTSTTTDVYETQLDRLSQELRIENPLSALHQLYANKDALINWTLYRERRTETVDMFFFGAMSISREREEEMVRAGGAKRYAQDYPDYYKNVLTYLYGTEQERETVLRGRGSRGLNLISEDVSDGGHPSEIAELIRLQFPDYKTLQPFTAIQRLIKSHFLWLYFKESEWDEIVTLLAPEASTIIKNIQLVVAPLPPILESTVSLYKVLLLPYLRQIGLALLRQRSPFAAALLTLPPNVEQLLTQAPVLATETNLQLASDVTLFDQLNAAFKNLTLRDLVSDKLFDLYLVSGRNAFVSRLVSLDTPPIDQLQEPTPETTVTPPRIQIEPDYPVLALHTIFRLYNAYVSDYLGFLENDLVAINTAVQKATRKIAQVVGDESYSLVPKVVDYKQRKAFTTQPINSGFVKLKPEVSTLLSRAYFHVQDHVESLRGLPQEGFHSPSAWETGLTNRFVEFVATIFNDNNKRFPDTYNSTEQYRILGKDLQQTMARLRRYSFGRCGNTYVISLNDRESQRPFFAQANDIFSMGASYFGCNVDTKPMRGVYGLQLF